ncbi:FixH family protein [Salinicoccus sp. HZC-1]|uniref:FixH family protein n=1 Tax=Salinicoccus sp. HZC-1 TaxID=3385497 RepID=UPI00398B498F
MKFKSLFSSILAASLLLAGCGTDGENSESGNYAGHEEGSDDEVRSLDVDLEAPETTAAGETVEFTAHVYSNGEDVTDADKVEFEVLDSEDNRVDMIEAEHSEAGLYTIEYTFEEAGEFSVISHVDALQMHTMPEKQITVE